MKVYKKFGDKYIFEYDEDEDGDWGSVFRSFWAFTKVFFFYATGFYLFCKLCEWLNNM